MRKIAMILFAGAALATAAYGQEASPAPTAPAEQKQTVSDKAKCCGENAKCCQGEQKGCCNSTDAKKANAKHQHGEAGSKGCCK